MSRKSALPRRLYYAAKPFIPGGARLRLRRFLAARTREASRGIWPIHEAAASPPNGWAEWPVAGRFPFVITHDVEGFGGLAKCRRLAELELSLGFRSSFNFIPEGGYAAPLELFGWLKDRGFEVGLHDLRHDGKLFASRRGFAKGATRINAHLRKWGAAGFRSGFMRHELDWMHDLEVEYDSSTFDTDPFEPQPDGAGTIFPFWVPAKDPGAARPGYAELPYTLAQDSTLFLILREVSPEIWLRKLDWIAAHGGMALVNIHPDYLRFPGDPATSSTYPVEHYLALLEHLRARHAGKFWNPLPLEIARHVSATQPIHRPRRPKRVCLVTYSFYERDARVLRYGRALAERGDEVDVVSLRSSPKLAVDEMLDGCRVVRLQDRSIDERSPLSFLSRLLRFLARSSRWIARSHARRPYDLVHVHNVPDFLVFAAWRPKLGGCKVILDIHDIVPELFESKFRVRASSLTVRLLKLMERASAALADHVILASDLWREAYVRRSARANKVSVLINLVDSRIFHPRPRTRTDQRKIVIFPGSLQAHQGLDVAIRAFPEVVAAVPLAELHIYGEGPAKEGLMRLSAELGLDGAVRFFGAVPTAQIVEKMANADLGVVPKRADGFGNEAFSTKILEFMSLGIPVVASSTKIDRFYFNDSVLRFFESGNSPALAHEIVHLLEDPEGCRQMTARAAAHAARNSWESSKAGYLELVDRLCGFSDEPAHPATELPCVLTGSLR